VLRALFLIIILCQTIGSLAQEKKLRLKPSNLSVYYGFGKDGNILFDDFKYQHKSKHIKISFDYILNDRTYYLSLAVQPQIQYLKHRLLNMNSMQPSEENFEENRIDFTQLNSLKLYALEFEISITRRIFKKTEAKAFVGVGPAYIDSETERLAKGFTFIENLGIAIRYQLGKQLFIELRPHIRHTSNAGIIRPNKGYNTLNMEMGLSIGL
jgi:hypothetical protein